MVPEIMQKFKRSVIFVRNDISLYSLYNKTMVIINDVITIGNLKKYPLPKLSKLMVSTIVLLPLLKLIHLRKTSMKCVSSKSIVNKNIKKILINEIIIFRMNLLK